MITHNNKNSHAIIMRQLLNMLCVLFFAISLLACSTLEGPDTFELKQSDVAVKINVNSDFVVISKDDTLQLQISVIAANGSSIEINPDSTFWISQDPSQVEVDQLGRIVGKVANNIPVRIIVAYKHNFNTVIDTVFTYVTNEKYEDASIKVVQIDSNLVGAFPFFAGVNNPRIRVDIYKDGVPIVKGTQIPVDIGMMHVSAQFNNSGGPDGEPVYFVANEYGYIGKFWIRSNGNLYGNDVSDSLLFFGQYPAGNAALWHWVTADVNGIIIPYSLNPLDLSPQLQPCGAFIVYNYTTRPFDVVFSDSAESGTVCGNPPNAFAGISVLDGNILGVPAGGGGKRRVNRVGLVHYYLRDAVTKETLPYSGRYESITVNTSSRGL